MVYDYISQDSPDKYNRGKGRKKEREGGVGGREGEKGREEGRREKEREGENRREERERQTVSLRNWLIGLRRLASPKSARQLVRLVTQKKVNVLASVKGFLEVEFLVLWGTSVFYSCRPSTDWTRSTHIIEGNLLYKKSTDLSVNFI